MKDDTKNKINKLISVRWIIPYHFSLVYCGPSFYFMIPLIQSVCSTSVMYIELVYRFGKRNSMPMMLSVTEYTHPLCAVFWYSCHIQNIKRVKIILLFLILFIRDAYVKRRVFTLIFKRILYSMSSLLNRRRNMRYYRLHSSGV